MPVSAEYLDYVLDQFAAFAKVTAQRMFGGVGLYSEDLFFALIDNDTLYLKVDDSNRADYTAEGSEQFRPPSKTPGTFVSMNYYTVPAEVLEDADQLAHWARKSLLVARAAKHSKKPAARKRKAKN